MTPRPVLLYTTTEAADRLRVTVSFLKRGATCGSLPHTRVGRFVRFSEQNLVDIIAMGSRPALTPLNHLAARRSA